MRSASTLVLGQQSIAAKSERLSPGHRSNSSSTLLSLICGVLALVLSYSSVAVLRLGPSASCLGSDASTACTLNSLVQRMQQLEIHNQQLQDMLHRQNAKSFASTPSPTKSPAKGVEPLPKAVCEDPKVVAPTPARPVATPARPAAPAALPDVASQAPPRSDAKEPEGKVNSATHPKEYARLASGFNCELWSRDFRDSVSGCICGCLY